jgi:excisionase family DNA binding protein
MPKITASRARKIVTDKVKVVPDKVASVPRLTYRRDEAAEALGVSVQTIDTWIARKLLRASKPPGASGEPGRFLLIRAADIETLLLATEVAA